MVTKTEDGREFRASAYLYVPDAEKPSEWKLRVEEEPGQITVAQLGRTAAALGPGYRGNRAEMPADARKAAARKLIALYHKQDVEDDDIPPYLWDLAGMAAPQEAKSAGDTLIAFGSALKALGDGRVGGHGITFGGKDITGEWYTPDTYLGPRAGDGADCLFHHSLPLKGVSADLSDHMFTPVKAVKDELGIFVETVLDMADQYERKVYEMVEAGKLGWSSGAPAHMVRKSADGEIKRWPIAEFSFTPTPAEPRNRAVSLKSLIDVESLRPNEPLDISGYLAAVSALPVADHALAVASAVKAFTERMEERLEFRATKDGRVLSSDNLTKIMTVDGHLEQARTHLADLMEACKPKKTVDGNALYARWLETNARLTGAYQ